METLSDAPPLPEVAYQTADKVTSQPSSPTAEHHLGSFPLAVAPNPLPHTDDEDSHLPGHENGYISSASSTQQSSSDILGRDLDEEELAHLNSAVSSRSSVSSIPASVLIHTTGGNKPSIASGTDNNPFTYSWVNNGNADYEKTEGFVKSVHTLRQREAAFRKPSSVRAMQMHTEDEGDDQFLTPPRRRSHRTSDTSMRSAGSSLKRSPYYTPNGSGNKQKVRKEFPLVLLHCNLLAPSIPVPAGVGTPSQKILKEVLPEQYWRRWRLLEEKVGSSVLRDRGVLISHPQDMYDLLEERLLESLELQRPRLDKGHFIGPEETDSEREGAYQDESATDDEQGEGCPDCGGRIIKGSHARKKWEIKVFAANGLMRAGAWAAAWKEMEKVDVEVGLWLPTDVRRELEKRLLEDEHSSLQHTMQLSPEEVQDNAFPHPKERSSSCGEQTHVPPQEFIPTDQETARQNPSEHQASNHGRPLAHEVDLQTLLINYIRVLASDKRNIAISVLSIVVVLLAIGGKSQVPRSDLRPFPPEPFAVESGTTPTMSPYCTLASEFSACPMVSSEPSTEVPMSPSAEAIEFEVSITSESSFESTTASEIQASSIPLSTPKIEALMSPSAEVELDMSMTSGAVVEPTLALDIPTTGPAMEASALPSEETTESHTSVTSETGAEPARISTAEESALNANELSPSVGEHDNSIKPTIEIGEVEGGITPEEEHIG